jgi:hypothetical protein
MLATTLNEIRLQEYLRSYDQEDADFFEMLDTAKDIYWAWRSIYEDADEEMTDDEGEYFVQMLNEFDTIIDHLEMQEATLDDVIEFVLDNGMTKEEVKQYA